MSWLYHVAPFNCGITIVSCSGKNIPYKYLVFLQTLNITEKFSQINCKYAQKSISNHVNTMVH